MDRRFMHPPLPRTRALVATAGIVAALLAATPWHHAKASPASPGTRLASLYWIFYKEDIERVNAFDPAIVHELVAGPGVYALTRSAHGPKLPPGVQPAENFFSAAALQRAVDTHSVYPGVKLVAEDPENWRATPMLERLTPIRYMDKFATIANSHGLTPILVPARDLVRVRSAVCTQRPQDTISQAYISCGIPAAADKARFYVIQAAAVETNLPALVQLVRQGAAAAHRANPNVIVLATLSAAPNGAPISYGAVVKAARAIVPYVKGFEMNSEPVNDRGLVSFLKALSS